MVPNELLDTVVAIAKKLTEKSWWAGGGEAAVCCIRKDALLLADLIYDCDCLKASAI
jgi:hypothetical protein